MGLSFKLVRVKTTCTEPGIKNLLTKTSQSRRIQPLISGHHRVAALPRREETHQNTQKLTRTSRDATLMCPFNPWSHPKESLTIRTHGTIIHQAKMVAMQGQGSGGEREPAAGFVMHILPLSHNSKYDNPLPFFKDIIF